MRELAPEFVQDRFQDWVDGTERPDYPPGLCAECGAPRPVDARGADEPCLGCRRISAAGGPGSARAEIARLRRTWRIGLARSPLWMALIAAGTTLLALGIALVARP